MRIVGIDPGSQSTGWAVLEAQTTRNVAILSCGTIRTPEKNLQHTLHHLHTAITESLIPFTGLVCAMEKTLVNKNPKSSLQLCHAKGALMVSLSLLDITIHEYYPKTIKKSLTGNGNACKESLKRILRFMFPEMQIQSLHEVDAIAIAMCHVYHNLTERTYL